MIKQLRIDSVRNLTDISLDITTSLSLICGQNGAGKTSVLEAINILGTGRSFRTHQISQVINNEKKSLHTFAALASDDKVGVERTVHSTFLSPSSLPR